MLILSINVSYPYLIRYQTTNENIIRNASAAKHVEFSWFVNIVDKSLKIDINMATSNIQLSYALVIKGYLVVEFISNVNTDKRQKK
ncbi:Hypothetical predicted protein [Octopus vulgaris]|uniref:Uncharacterized protein n=1 Tax=Octopus vulgaris TaxID=6645 RepID=A0AA36APF8_OCTVU|nr:Hypothetical predicted protein [Octopus vulgaris]